MAQTTEKLGYVLSGVMRDGQPASVLFLAGEAPDRRRALELASALGLTVDARTIRRATPADLRAMDSGRMTPLASVPPTARGFGSRPLEDATMEVEEMVDVGTLADPDARKPLRPYSPRQAATSAPARPLDPVPVTLPGPGAGSAPAAVRDESKYVNALGVAGVCIGSIAMLAAWIPFVGLLAIPVALLGAILSVVGLAVAITGKRSGTGWPITGVILGGLAIGASITSTFLIPAWQKASASAQRVRAATAAGVTAPTTTSANAAPAAPPASATPVGPVWHPASQAITIDGIEVTIRGLAIEKDERESEEQLHITIEVRNLTQTRRLRYMSWGESRSYMEDEASLEDEFGNSYYVGGSADDRIVFDSADPDESITDVIVFERPLKTATKLRLLLRGRVVDVSDDYRFEIDTSTIER